MRPSIRGALPSLVAVVALFAIWEGACRGFGIRPFILPMPSLIAAETWRRLADRAEPYAGDLRHRACWGFAASVLISLPLAMLIASSPAISAAIYPLLVITQSIPKVALAPILIVALGANELPRIIVTFLVAFFPLVVGTVAGLLATPPELIELGRACRAGQAAGAAAHPPALRGALRLRRAEGGGGALGGRRGGGGIRRRRCRPRLPDPDLDGLLPHAAGLRRRGAAGGHGHRAVPGGRRSPSGCSSRGPAASTDR